VVTGCIGDEDYEEVRMLQDAFDKLTIGSTVSLRGFPIFQGTVKDIKKDTGMALVDFLPNTMTGGGDPEPYWSHYNGIEVIAYAQASDFKEEVKKVLHKWTMYSQDLHNEIAEFMNIWKL
jgi:hypothetical protein